MNILIINAHPDYQNALRGTNQLADFTLKQIQQHLPDAHIETWIIHRISKKQRNPTIHTGLRCFGVSPIGCAYMLRLSR